MVHIPGWCIYPAYTQVVYITSIYPGGGPCYAHTRVVVPPTHIPGLVCITQAIPGLVCITQVIPGCGRGVTYPGVGEVSPTRVGIPL